MDRLSTERWQLIDRVFAEALALPPEKREAYLTYACAHDAQLIKTVRDLLDSDVKAEAFIGESITQFTEVSWVDFIQRAVDDSSLPAGTKVGHYRIVQPIGHGGMAAVYLGERDDDQYRREVAIKLIKPGMDSAEILRRFRYERQILAALEHPRIARLYDAGLTAKQRPYLVMEYVKGRPITTHCDDLRLDIEERLRLFRAVCDAVTYAHRNLVVHRDLKPSNIFVTEDAEVKLLDFGIAKLLADDPFSTEAVTRTGVHPMTPEFASPEQLEGGKITTATDVYALGVLLYELLSGRRPFTAEDTLRPIPVRASTSVQRAVSVRLPGGHKIERLPDDVARARATSPERLRRRLEGDLDILLEKALHPEPERRYRTAEQLMDDLDRHLQGHPISARRDSLLYRADKFIRRHSIAVAAAALVVLSLAGGLAVAMWQGREARHQSQVAQQVSTFILNLFESPDPFAPDATERPDTLRLRDFMSRASERTRGELDATPEVKSRLLEVLASVHSNLGMYEEAQELLSELLALRQDHEEETEGYAHAASLLGAAYARLGNFAHADSLFRNAIRIQRQIYGEDAPDLLESQLGLANSLIELARYDEADSLLRHVLAVGKERYGDDHQFVADSEQALANLLYAKGEFEEAVQLLRDVLRINRSIYGDRHAIVAESISNLGFMLDNLGDHEAAEPLYREALEMHRELLGSNHPAVANDLDNLASVRANKGDFAGAEPYYREGLQILIDLYGEVYPQTPVVMTNLAGVLRAQKKFEEAEELARRAARVSRQLYGNEHPYVAIDLFSVGLILRESGRPSEAVPLYRESLDILTRALPPNHVRLSVTRVGLGAALTDVGEYEEAEELLLLAYDMYMNTRGAPDRLTFGAAKQLQLLYEAWGRTQDANRFAEAAKNADPRVKEE